MRFQVVLLLLALNVFQVLGGLMFEAPGICIESARGNVLSASPASVTSTTSTISGELDTSTTTATYDLSSASSCGPNEEWELVHLFGTNYYLKHVSTGTFLLPQLDLGITLLATPEDKLDDTYVWIETEIGEAGSGVFSYLSMEYGDYLRVDSQGVGMSSNDDGLDEQFIKK